MRPLVVVSAGTYHFPFDRLMTWTETWLAAHPEADVVVQRGVSRAVTGAENHDVLGHAALLELYRRATVVVLQGGAGGVMDATQLGIRPIVVPRVPVDNEVVDEHQIVFSRTLAGLGLVHVTESEDDLHHLLDEAVDGRLDVRQDRAYRAPGAVEAARRLDALVGAERVEPRSPRAWQLVRTLIRTLVRTLAGRSPSAHAAR